MKQPNNLKDRLQNFKKRFKLDSHHTIERVGVVTAVVAILGVFTIGGTVVSAYNNNKTALDNTALYTPTTTTSLSGQKATIPGLYVNEKRTRALILFNFKDGVNNLPTDPKEYQMFLTETDTKLKHHNLKKDGDKYSAKYVVFGNAENMGVVLDKQDGFDLKILDLVIRSNKIIAKDRKGQGASGTNKDLSFNDYDQWRVIFNPAAKNATVADLGQAGGDFNPATVYYDVVSKPQEQELRDKMDAKLVTMRADIERINQAEASMATTAVDDRGQTIKIVTPKAPEIIEGDKVVGDEAKDEKPSTLRLQTTSVIGGGYDFNWRDGNIKNGYLDEIVPEGQSYLSYLQTQQSVNTPTPNFSGIQFTLNTGANLSSYDSKDTLMQPLFQARNNLVEAWTSYYNNKREYQTKLYPSLLNLEIALRNVETNSTQSAHQKILTVY